MPLEGEAIGRYRLLRLLGNGGMGEVYLAEDTPIQRQIVLKIIRTEGVANPADQSAQEATRLFQREAKAIATLDHPYILPLYDYGETRINGMPIAYLVMPYRPEGSLAGWLQSQRNTPSPQSTFLYKQSIAHFIGQAAEALQHAHNHQIVHQDVKPANFLLRGNTEHPQQFDLLLADFGIAKFTAATVQNSMSVRGTPTYMAPEQLEGSAGPATDQYALAIMAYELLAGRTPFQGSLGQIMYQQFHEQPLPPSTYNPSIPPDLDTVILQALKKKPAERFHSVKAFARAFQTAIEEVNAPTLLSVRPEPSTDMQVNLVISDGEARSGTQRSLVLHDGKQISVAVPAGAYTGQLLRLEGQGLPANNGQTGALYVSLTVTPPLQALLKSNIEPTIAVSGNYAPVQKTQVKHSRGLIALLAFFAIVIVAGSVGVALFYASSRNQPTSANASGNTPPHSSAPTQTTGDPYTHQGRLVLNDPLRDNSQNVGWMTGINENNATCTFIGGIYQSSQPVDGDFHACLALNSDFSNMVYEVQMTIISGYAGGIIFRANQANSTSYLFRVGQDGSYDLRAYIDVFIDHSHLLAGGFSPAIHRGTNQTNVIAVVANGSSLQLYVNDQLISSVNDDSFSYGQIGIVSFNQGGFATVDYKNARVWAI